MDLVRRALRYDGYKLKGVMNITDVGHLLSDSDDGEDKMVIASKRTQKTPQEIAEMYTTVFFEDLAKLNIGKPEIIVKATDHVSEMIVYVKELLDNGFAYETSDGIYFDIAKFPRYGMLSGANLTEQLAGARVGINSDKHSPADFALWKKAEPAHIMRWDSPWGDGYPGWHIECSVMSKKYLGETFDIHSGGVDHIPIHHENEIAQNEAISGKKSVNYWIHGEFMLVDGGKMSKSLGNTYTISDLEERGYAPLDFRYFCLNAHYRTKLNFTFAAMDAAKTSREKLLVQISKHKASTTTTPHTILDTYRQSFKQAIEDDVNVPLALGILHTAIKESKSIDIYKLACEFDEIFGLSLNDVQPYTESDNTSTYDIPEAVLELSRERTDAKNARNYQLADSIRAKISDMGYLIVDTKGGVTITPKAKP
jgi:cysteinyl-tRNA synthetase